MRKHLAKLVTVIGIFSLTSCKTDPKELKNNESFDYQITMHITGDSINGIPMTLVIPGKEKQTDTIENNTLQFHGTIDKPTLAEIDFSYDLEHDSRMMDYIPVILEPEAVEITAQITDDPYMFKSISEFSYSKGKASKAFKNYVDHAYGTEKFSYVENYEAKKDSLHLTTYPKEKKHFFNTIDSLYTSQNNTAFVAYLNLLLESSIPQFDSRYITEEDSLQFQNILKKVDSTHIAKKDYQDLVYHIKKITARNKEVAFKDFTLPNSEGGMTTLSDIVQQNEYTVLDFWWSNCAPCRDFNKKTVEHYQMLQEHQIGIIGINIDIETDIWKKCSKQDQIPWTDLYAGANSEIQRSYQAYMFPVKIVIDKNMNIVDFKFKEAPELLSLVQ